jgi:ligand-binding SRPBCC domain-containing protein
VLGESPRYMIKLCAEIEIQAGAERCFDLARSVDLHVASSTLIKGRAVAGRTSGLAELHDKTTWSARFFGLRFQLTTEIVELRRPEAFSDVLCDGLFRHFGHLYTFRRIAPAVTMMRDDFSFESPGGPAGRALDSYLLRRHMHAQLDYRARYIKRVAESDDFLRFLGATWISRP